ncbi:MAG TPA: diaminopropionate ammonia-lyase, partial [Chloroflexia bacterium]|nr:diaminopropionate ammonia-lyase [Chloroflexia bacterium]
MTILINPHREPGARPTDAMLAQQAAREVTRLLAQCFVYEPTPLVALPTVARNAHLGAVYLKDEGARLGLRSFKALGGAYAVLRLVLREASRQLNRTVVAGDLPYPASGWRDLADAASGQGRGAADVARVAARMTFGCATDGNHGQSVAAGARLVGAHAVIFVHEGVSAERRGAIARFGAEIREVPGTYDDAVAESLRQCAQHGWTLVSDTSWPGYTDVPRLVMQGYTAMAQELATQLATAPTHVLLQTGVGGFAAALATALYSVFAPAAPSVILLEPARAACFLASAQAGTRLRIAAGEPTVMAMLECYEPSAVAWDLLKPVADAFVTVEDAEALSAMRLLAHPVADAEVVVAGESGAAGLAGLLQLCADGAA